MKKSERRLRELKALAANNNGVLTPDAVVARASNPKSALHDAFEWDDTEAARKYRLEQARQLIRVCIEVIGDGVDERKVTAFVALREDRYGAGGYRHIPTLVQTRQGRDALLDTALWELRAYEEKYSELKELMPVFVAARRVRRAHEK
jgi:hypothetical protein